LFGHHPSFSQNVGGAKGKQEKKNKQYYNKNPLLI
jgi:hypothetical protein